MPTDWSDPNLSQASIDAAAKVAETILNNARPKASYINARRNLEVIEAIVKEAEIAGLTHISVQELREAVNNIKQNEGII